jgi:hypothetical protein
MSALSRVLTDAVEGLYSPPSREKDETAAEWVEWDNEEPSKQLWRRLKDLPVENRHMRILESYDGMHRAWKDSQRALFRANDRLRLALVHEADFLQAQREKQVLATEKLDLDTKLDEKERKLRDLVDELQSENESLRQALRNQRTHEDWKGHDNASSVSREKKGDAEVIKDLEALLLRKEDELEQSRNEVQELRAALNTEKLVADRWRDQDVMSPAQGAQMLQQLVNAMDMQAIEDSMSASKEKEKSTDRDIQIQRLKQQVDELIVDNANLRSREERLMESLAVDKKRQATLVSMVLQKNEWRKKDSDTMEAMAEALDAKQARLQTLEQDILKRDSRILGLQGGIDAQRLVEARFLNEIESLRSRISDDERLISSLRLSSGDRRNTGVHDLKSTMIMRTPDPACHSEACFCTLLLFWIPNIRLAHYLFDRDCCACQHEEDYYDLKRQTRRRPAGLDVRRSKTVRRPLSTWELKKAFPHAGDAVPLTKQTQATGAMDEGLRNTRRSSSRKQEGDKGSSGMRRIKARVVKINQAEAGYNRCRCPCQTCKASPISRPHLGHGHGGDPILIGLGSLACQILTAALWFLLLILYQPINHVAVMIGLVDIFLRLSCYHIKLAGYYVRYSVHHLRRRHPGLAPSRPRWQAIQRISAARLLSAAVSSTIVFTLFAFVAVEYERRIWLEANNWRVAYLRDIMTRSPYPGWSPVEVDFGLVTSAVIRLGAWMNRLLFPDRYGIK